MSGARRPFIVLLCALALPAFAASQETALKIVPGPKTISEEERALTDPAAAVVLVDETALDDSAAGHREVRRHVRAKVLRNEGRELADIEIPMFFSGDRLYGFWGRTLLPDGRVFEIALEQVTYQQIAKGHGGYRFRYARAALPGVIPGAVIDYGYELHEGRLRLLERIDLQQRWPVQNLRLRWRPYSGEFASAHRIWNRETVNPEVAKDGRILRLEVRDVPGFEREPFMPPDPQVRPSVALYYMVDAEDARAYWGRRAADEQEDMEAFFKDDASLRETIAGWKLPAEMDLQDKLKHAFTWIGTHVRNLDLAASEEVRPDLAAVEGKERSARHVLAEGEGTSWELAALFAGFAKVLGAQPVPVLAPDRTEQVWDVEVAAPFRFDEVLAGIRRDSKLTLCAPGRGLAYGEAPWWTTGVPALLPGGIIQVPAPSATRSMQEVSGTLAFPESNTAEIHWTSRATGQQALDVRQSLGHLKGSALQERLDEICGGGGKGEVESAAAEGVEHMGDDVKLLCTVRLSSALPDEDEEVDGYKVAVVGPWAFAPPDFEGRTERRHPIVFPYPRVDTARIKVAAPPGFVPAPDPVAPVVLESPYGRYKLAITRSETGFVVERGYALTALTVPAKEYAPLRAFFDGIRRADRATVTFFRADTER